ncbi:hypothetical protein R6L23_10000 [Streptomyces sp. SR27]|uniref:hypothetical protein n=1 Tax=Streptomyces sp. SR27 TaxID=3076630 RepID=UPI00295BF1CC|nr:hypothetical protein [Streptomyces sp. SR27]MDV9188544.1 hypothetical protein [Streptomyces sp. SR27]
MRTLLVHHDAGRRFDGLADRLDAVMKRTAPLVEMVTGLALPDTVVIRTMTVRKWLSAHRRNDRALLLAEDRELQPSPSDRRTAKSGAKVRRRSRRIMWPGIGAQVVDFDRGRPEMVVLPQALREAGRLDDEPVLQKIVAHEMTHLAHFALGAGSPWDLMTTRYAGLRGVGDRDFSFLVEGHAYWTDQQITTKLLGAPVPTAEISPHATLRYRALAATPQRNATLAYFTRAASAVGTIIDAQGLDVFNGVWSDPELVPLRSETDTPDLWIRRFG